MKRIMLISDTHGYLDNKIVQVLDSFDEVWHAGDIGSLEVCNKISAKTKLRAVYGNIDGHEIRMEFPERQSFSIEGVRVCITHIAGRPPHYPSPIRTWLNSDKPDIFICGHSHILLVQRDQKAGFLHLNPGAAGIHGFHKVKTYLRFKLLDGKITDLEAIELGQRGQIT